MQTMNTEFQIFDDFMGFIPAGDNIVAVKRDPQFTRNIKYII
jgi:hypothetical protein